MAAPVKRCLPVFRAYSPGPVTRAHWPQPLRTCWRGRSINSRKWVKQAAPMSSRTTRCSGCNWTHWQSTDPCWRAGLSAVDEEFDSSAQWPDQLFGHFKRAHIRQVGYVPDAGHARLIRRCIDDPEIADVLLTSEEEGVGLVCGAALAGERAALL